MLTVSAPVIDRPLVGCCGHASACTGFGRAVGEPAQFRLGRDKVIRWLDGYGMGRRICLARRPESGAARYRFARLE